MKMLAIETDPTNMKFISALLKREGYAVLEADTAYAMEGGDRAGCDGYIPKPICYKGFLGRVKLG